MTSLLIIWGLKVYVTIGQREWEKLPKDLDWDQTSFLFICYMMKKVSNSFDTFKEEIIYEWRKESRTGTVSHIAKKNCKEFCPKTTLIDFSLKISHVAHSKF